MVGRSYFPFIEEIADSITTASQTNPDDEERLGKIAYPHTQERKKIKKNMQNRTKTAVRIETALSRHSTNELASYISKLFPEPMSGAVGRASKQGKGKGQGLKIQQCIHIV